MEKSVKITVNGQTLEAQPEETLLQCMLRHKIMVPHFCYHPKLSIAGVCRMCLVEVEGARKLEISCSLPVREGMVVHTESAKVQEGRAFVMEFTLVNHPLDCPICDQAGECWLQEYYMDHDRKESAMLEDKVHKDKARVIGPRVMLDQERCILCTRCVRFTDEITHTHELGIFNRGDHSILDVVPNSQLNNPYSENVVDICPVGALTSSDFRFDGRVWFLKEADSICPGCARGCNTVVHHRDNVIRRILPRINESVNGHFMCDFGRDVYKWVHAEDRLLVPQIENGQGMKSASWLESFEKTTSLIRKFNDQHEAGELVGMASPRACNEDNVAFCQFLEAVFGSCGVTESDLTPRVWSGLAKDELLRVEDTNPNTRGAELAVRSFSGKGLKKLSREQFLKALRDGKIQGLIVLEQDLFESSDRDLRALLKQALPKLELLIVLSTHQDETTKLAQVVFPITTFAEQEGSFVNVKGLQQHFLPAIVPLGESLPARRILNGLAGRLGASVVEAKKDSSLQGDEARL